MSSKSELKSHSGPELWPFEDEFTKSVRKDSKQNGVIILDFTVFAYPVRILAVFYKVMMTQSDNAHHLKCADIC